MLRVKDLGSARFDSFLGLVWVIVMFAMSLCMAGIVTWAVCAAFSYWWLLAGLTVAGIETWGWTSILYETNCELIRAHRLYKRRSATLDLKFAQMI